MTPTVRLALIVIATVAVVWGMVASVRWAKRGGSRAAVAGAVMLAIGSLLAGKPPPAHNIENLRDDKGKKDEEDNGPSKT